MRRALHSILATTAAAVALTGLSGCGGGGGGGGASVSPLASGLTLAAPTVAAPAIIQADCSVLLWGDSILRGDTLAGLLSETPSAALKRMRPAYTVLDQTKSGDYVTLRLGEFLNASITSRFVVIGDGVNDAGHDLEYEQPLRSMVQRVKSQGHTPVITGLSRVAKGVPNRDAYDAIAKRVASEEAALFADWGTVAYDAADMADDVHPGQPYSTRLAERLVAKLDSVAPECAK